MIKGNGRNKNYFFDLLPRSEEAPRFWERDFPPLEDVGGGAAGGGEPSTEELELEPELSGWAAEAGVLDLFLSNLRKISLNKSSDRTTNRDRI